MPTMLAQLRAQDMSERMAARVTPWSRKRAAIFGSVARGTETEVSDVDILVEFEAGRSLLDLAALERTLSALLGCDVQVITYGSLNPRIRARALADQVPIYEQ